MDESSEKLERTLDAWDSVEVSHPRLRQRVWTRIATEDREPAALPSFFRLAQSILSRPAYAAAFVTVCVLGGLLLAELRVAQQQAERSEQLAKSYQQVIDPLLKNTYLYE